MSFILLFFPFAFICITYHYRVHGLFFSLPVEYVDRREISSAVVSALLEMLFGRSMHVSMWKSIHVA